MERTLKFERYLPEHGYRARVLTTGAFGPCTAAEDPAEAGIVRAWEPLGLFRRLSHRDRGDQVPPSYIRTDAARLAGIRSLLKRRLLIPDGQIGWLPHATYAALRVLRREPVAAIYSSFPPGSAHLLGLLLKRLTGLPWVADFRDSWIYDPLDPALAELPYRRAAEQRMERRVVETADVVVAATDITADRLRCSYPGRAGAIRVITNGFDPADYAGVRAVPAAPGSGPMRLVHAGSFTASHPQRSLDPLLAALRILQQRDAAWTERLRLVLAGHLTAAETAAAAELTAAGTIELTGRVSHHQALALQAGAHILVLVDHPRPWPASNVPGKLYEYLAFGRPILAICGPGMVHDLVHGLRAGRCVSGEQPDVLADRLAQLYAEYSTGHLPRPPARAALVPFHRRHLAARLAACLDQAITSTGNEPC